MRYFVVLIIVLILVSCADIEPKKDLFAIAFINGGPVVCSEFEEVQCGLHLWNCADELNYHCVHNVTIISPDELDYIYNKRKQDF